MSKYSTIGWKNTCDISDAEIDNKIKQINLSFGRGTVDTFVLFQTKDFQINVNYNNMVLAMCTKDIFTVDLDFDSGRWNTTEAYQTVKRLQLYSDFMHKRGTDLLFKLFRTDKGMHAVLVNKRLQSNTEEAVRMSVALCNDPFYTAFSKIFGYCLRIGPKVYRKMESSKSLYSRVTSEIVSKEYNDPKYVGYGKEDRLIGKLLDIKNSLVKFTKRQYKDNFYRMTKLRYIPYIDDFRMCPNHGFFEKLVELTVSLYSSNIDRDYQIEQYQYNFIRNLSFSSLAEAYKQSNLSLAFDLYEYIWSFGIKNVLVVTYKNVTADTFVEITDGLTKYSFQNGDRFVVLSNDKELVVIDIQRYHDNVEDSDVLKFKDLNEDLVYSNSFYMRVSPIVKVENEKVIEVVYDLSPYLKKILNDEFILINPGEDNQILKLITLAKDTNNYLFDLYRNETEEMTKNRKLREKIVPVFSPSVEKIDQIRRHFISMIDNIGIKEVEKVTDITKFVKSNRYLDILRTDDIRECYKTLNNVKKQMKILKPYVIKAAGINFLYSHGDYPFVLGQSDHANMIFVSTYDVLMLDWDVKLGITKATAILLLRRFLESQKSIPLSKRLFKSEPCFKIYETDNGTHAYLISDFIPHSELIASKLMIEVCSDINYAAMTRFKGFSIRLSPKIFVDKKYTGPDFIENQFIQKEGLYVGDKLVNYVGDESKIDPHIEEFVDIIYKTQENIMSYDNQSIYDAMYNRDQQMVAKWLQFFIDKYNGMKHKRKVPQKALIWSRDVDVVERIETIV